MDFGQRAYSLGVVTNHVYSKGLAIMRAGNERYTVGVGPFDERASAPDSGIAFYCNDFILSDSKPWKIPAEVFEVESLDSLAGLGLLSDELDLDWEELNTSGFASVFTEINEKIIQGVIEKSVPVVTERAKVVSGDPAGLIRKLAGLGDSFFTYGWSLGGKGFCGGTPELLFELQGLDLKTMALAGTAKFDEKEVFAVDGKEIREHEFVAQTLVAKLSDIGQVKRAERSILDLGKLVHFYTPIEVELFSSHGVDELIRKLHPTPALGPLPRHLETLSMLTEWRERLDCPAYFGAPFGLLKDGFFNAVVAIRGVHWQEGELAIPSGCGVIEASRLMNEWRELRLKREAVKDVFGL